MQGLKIVKEEIVVIHWLDAYIENLDDYRLSENPINMTTIFKRKR